MIDSFRGEYRFLSNFYVAKLYWEGYYWPTSEHAFQAAKSLDPDYRWAVRNLATPGRAKRYGRLANRRADWEDIKIDIMRKIVKAKFDQNPYLMHGLIATAPQELVEGNAWGDTFWGVCNGVGENHLGKILMEIRDGNAS